MKFNNILETIFIGSLTFFITFSSVSATTVVNNVDENGNVFLTNVDGAIDKTCRLQCFATQFDVDKSYKFKIVLLCYRLNNIIQPHPLAEKYVNLSSNLKLVVNKLNGDKVDERKLVNYGSYSNNSGEFIDFIGILPKKLFTIEDGTYNVDIYNGDEFLGSFKNVKFERTT